MPEPIPTASIFSITMPLLSSLLLLLTLGCQPATNATQPPGPTVRFLGSAQDGGFPHAACLCERCEAAISSPTSARNVASLALLDGERSYLIDATPDIREQLRMLRDRSTVQGRVNRQPLDGIFLTHAHLGHYTGLAFFGFEAIHAQAIPLFASEAMLKFLQGNGPWSQLFDLENLKAMRLSPASSIQLSESLNVTAIKVPHRDEFADTVGFLIAGPTKRLFYVPDTDGWDAWDEPIESWLEQHSVDILVADGTFFSLDELPGRDVSSIGHPLIEDSMERLSGLVEAGSVEVYFTHFNHSNPLLNADGETARRITAAGFKLIEDGLEIEL
jgi:pyrroloquinoline quinone biosynthesis protein B